MKQNILRHKSNLVWIVWGVELNKPDFPRFEGTLTECVEYLVQWKEKGDKTPNFVECPDKTLEPVIF